MALSYAFEGPVVVFTFESGTPSHEIYAQFHRAFTDPGCPERADVLVDLTRSTSLASRTPEVVKGLTEYVLQHPHRPGARMAVLLTTAERERLDAVAAKLRAPAGVEMRMFDDPKTAREWLARSAHGAS